MKPSPLYIHEDLVSKLFAADPITRERIEDDALAALHGAAKSARVAVEDIKSIHLKIMQNPMQTPLRNAQQSREAAWRRAKATTQVMDAVIERAGRAIDELQAAMALPKAKDALTAFAYSDIRRALAGMNSAERKSTILHAIEATDYDTMAAIYGSPSFVSGIEKRDADLFLTSWNTRYHSEKLDRIDRLKGAIEAVEKMGQGLNGWVNGLTDSEAIKRAEESERAAKVREI